MNQKDFSPTDLAAIAVSYDRLERMSGYPDDAEMTPADLADWMEHWYVHDATTVAWAKDVAARLRTASPEEFTKILQAGFDEWSRVERKPDSGNRTDTAKKSGPDDWEMHEEK